jgi:hypothetical protein
MIRTKRLTQNTLGAWLLQGTTLNVHPTYRLRVWKEVHSSLAPLKAELISYVQEALDDARRRMRHGFEDSLSPFFDPAMDPARNYPAKLHRVTQQGYFGETLAALAVEHYGAIGHTDWQVPAMLFRFHDQEFQHLDFVNERIDAGVTFDQDAEAEKRPGRTGDDALAFRVGDDGRITDILTLEAKCLGLSHTATIADAHSKLVAGPLKPSGVRELINLLNDYDTPEAEIWQERLLHFLAEGFKTATRHDGLAYAVGRGPLRPASRTTWLTDDSPHPIYTLGRRFDAMEFHFENLDGVIDIIYRGV